MSRAGGTQGEAEAKKELESLGVPELKARLKARGLSASGKKQALVMRLLTAEDKGLAPSPKEIAKTKTVTTKRSSFSELRSKNINSETVFISGLGCVEGADGCGER
jgi:hypothetical protein